MNFWLVHFVCLLFSLSYSHGQNGFFGGTGVPFMQYNRGYNQGLGTYGGPTGWFPPATYNSHEMNSFSSFGSRGYYPRTAQVRSTQCRYNSRADGRVQSEPSSTPPLKPSKLITNLPLAPQIIPISQYYIPTQPHFVPHFDSNTPYGVMKIMNQISNGAFPFVKTRTIA